MPDFQSVLNTFVWQDYDLAPDHPKLFKFIEYWQDEIEGPLHSVRFVHRKMLAPGEWRNVTGEFTLARQEDKDIVFVLSHRHFDLADPKPIPFDSELAEPMRRAWRCRSPGS